ncbi:hypothetical protein N8303_04545 [Gammaproteobacteria bacterium]|nr:hypothetical protein [Gammaproteobacteria bacterium]
MKNILKKILNYFNYTISHHDFNKSIYKFDHTFDVRSINYFISEREVLINVRLDNGRGLPINTFGSSSNHPFSIAAKISSTKNEKEQLICAKNILQEYYKKVAPSDINALLGLSSKSKFFTYPSWAIVMPWQAESPEEHAAHVARSVKSENESFDKSATIDDGWAWTGPINIKKCEIEAVRIIKILRSVMTHGYLRSDSFDGDIIVDILVNENNDWVWQSCSAQHRVAVLSGLGFDSAPVRVRKVIQRNEAEYWPNVVNKLFTKDEALRVFDNIFYGDFKFVTAKWDVFLKENGLLNEIS